MSQVYSNELAPSSTRPPHYSSRFAVDLPKSQQRVSYRVELEKGQDGWIIAKCPDVEGAISQGRNRDEALRNIVEAISIILEDTFGKKAQEFLILWEEK